MSATLTAPPRPDGGAGELGLAGGRPVGPAPRSAHDDAWPRTSRWLPWMLALFMVMLWLVPFDSATAQVNLPVDGKLDRLLIIAMALTWLLTVFTGRRASPRWRPSAVDVALLIYVGVAVLSVVLDSGVLAKTNDLQLAVKKLSLLFSYAFFYFFVSTTLRPREVSRFVKLGVGLAVVTSIGVLVQRYTGTNYFFKWAHSYLPGSAFLVQDPATGLVSGPTIHPLATAAILSMVLPFPLVAAMQAKTVGAKLVRYLVAAVLLWAIFATGRKTGDYALAAAFLALVAVRPRALLRLLPIVLVGLGLALVVKPHGVATVVQHLNPVQAQQGESSLHRKVTYPAIVPDVRDHVVIGRGYGSYDPHKYRILDNQVLLTLIEVGLLGLGALVIVLLSIVATAWRSTRLRDPAQVAIGLAAIAATAAFATTTWLFDTLSFEQVPYVLLLLAGWVVASRERSSSPARPVAAVSAAASQMWAQADRLRPERLRPPARRREAEPLRGLRVPGPIRRRQIDEHVGAQSHNPAQRPGARRGEAVRGLRRRALAAARSRTAKTLAVIATLGLTASVLGRGSGAATPTVLAQSPNNSSAFAALAAPAAAKGAASQGAPAGQRPAVGPAPSYVAYAPAASPSTPPGSPGGASSNQQPGAANTTPARPTKPKHRKAHKPRHLAPAHPGTTQQTSTQQQSTGNPSPGPGSCLPPGTPVIVEQVLQTANVNVCKPLTGMTTGSATARLHAVDARLRAAVAAGKLTQAQYETMIADIARAYGFTPAAPSTPASAPATATAPAGGTLGSAASSVKSLLP